MEEKITAELLKAIGFQQTTTRTWELFSFLVLVEKVQAPFEFNVFEIHADGRTEYPHPQPFLKTKKNLLEFLKSHYYSKEIPDLEKAIFQMALDGVENE